MQISIERLKSCLPALERSGDAAIWLKAAQLVALNYRGASHKPG